LFSFGILFWRLQPLVGSWESGVGEALYNHTAPGELEKNNNQIFSAPPLLHGFEKIVYLTTMNTMKISFVIMVLNFVALWLSYTALLRDNKENHRD